MSNSSSNNYYYNYIDIHNQEQVSEEEYDYQYE
jgi:hypothetical protein